MNIMKLGLSWMLIAGSLFAAGLSLTPGTGDKCAVCGMFVSEFKTWVSAVEFKDGGRAWFDGPKDLFTYLHDLKQYAPGRRAADIGEILVTDYYSTKAIRARDAFFVAGSDVMGPMGAELAPFIRKADAETFLKDHKGTKILPFDEVTPAILSSLK